MSNLDSDYKSFTSSNGYSTLACYNPKGAGARKGSGRQIIPTYGNPGYGTLQHGHKNVGGGHFSYTKAYERLNGCGQKYVSRVCGGCAPPPE